MYFLKKLFFITFLSFILLLSGCQSNNSGVSDEAISNNDISIKTDINSTKTTVQADNNSTNRIQKLSIVNESNISVENSSEEKEINIIAFDKYGSSLTEGEISFTWPQEIIDKGIDIGSITPAKAALVDGKTQFIYTAPSNLTMIKESGYDNIKFLFYSINKPDINVTLDINFNPLHDYIPSKPILKNIALSDSSIKVQVSKQINNLTVYAYSNQDTTNINTTLDIKYPEIIMKSGIDIGTLPSEIKVINGQAKLNYTGPINLNKTVEKLKALDLNNSITLNLYNQETSINIDLHLTFLAEEKYTNYILTAVTESSKISQENELKTIDIYLKSANNQPASDEPISINYFDGSYGTMNSFSGVTDNNGHLIFEYTAPNSIDTLNDFNISFQLLNDSSIKAFTTINIDLDIKKKKYQNYKLTAVALNSIITDNLQSKQIDIYLENNNHRPAVDEIIVLKYFDGTFGSVNSFSGITDGNGHVEFTYTSAVTLRDGDDYLLKFSLKNDSSIEDEVWFKVQQDSNKVASKKYKLTSSLQTNDIPMNLLSSKLILFTIKTDDELFASNEEIESITVKLLRPSLGIIEDSKNKKATNLQFNHLNNVQIKLTTNNISGVLPIEVKAILKSGEELSKIFNISLRSGPASAISISYVGEPTLISSRAKFTETWILTITDKYNNPVNSNPVISTGVMVGYAQSSDTTSNDSNYLYFNPSEDKNGTLDIENQNFQVNNTPFDNVDQTNEYLVTFANGYSYNASGKWDINIDLNNRLDLVDKFEGNNSSNLGFAVGHNYRQDRCEEGVEWLANSYTKNNNYTIDNTGTIKIIVEYDYYLVGKSVMLWTNLIETNNEKTVRLGESRKITLKGLGLNEVTPRSVPNGTNSKVYRFHIPVKGINSLYSNAKFSYRVDSTNLIINNIQDSNGDLDNCQAYVDITVTDNNTTDNKDGMITLKNLEIIDEF